MTIFFTFVMLLLASSVLVLARGDLEYNINIRGILATSYPDSSGAVVTRQLGIPNSNGVNITEDRYEEEIIPGALQKPSGLTSFCDTHKFTFAGTDYVATLGESSVLIWRNENSRTVLDSHYSYPDGCRAHSIQSASPDEGPGFFYVVFEPGCVPMYVDSQEGDHDQDGSFNHRSQVLILEGPNHEYDGQRLTYYAFLENGNLVIRFVRDNFLRSTLNTSKIGCSTFTSIYPFSKGNANSSTMSIMADCFSPAGIALRYVIFFDSQGAIVSFHRINAATGTPLSDGKQFVAVIDGQMLYVQDIYSALPAGSHSFTTAPVDHIHFISSNSFTRLVVYRTGENVLLIDVNKFVANGRASGLEDQPGTIINSCNPFCPPVEPMGTSFVMMAALNPDNPAYDVVFRPLDPKALNAPTRVEQVSSRLPLLSFIQTSLEVVTSPPPVPTPSPTPDGSSPGTDEKGSKHQLVLGLAAIGVSVLLIVLVCVLLSLCIHCFLCPKRSKPSILPLRSLIKKSDENANSSATIVEMKGEGLPEIIVDKPPPQPDSKSMSDTVSRSDSESGVSSLSSSPSPVPPHKPPIQEEGEHETTHPRPASTDHVRRSVPTYCVQFSHLHAQECEPPDSAIHSKASSCTSLNGRN